MYEQVDKPKENKNRAVANSVAQKKSNGRQGFGFVDNRPMMLGQKSMQLQNRGLPKKTSQIQFQRRPEDGTVQRVPTVTKSASYRGSDSHYDTIKGDLEIHYGLTDHAIEVTNGVHYMKKNGRLYGMANKLIPVFYYDYKLNGGGIMHHEVHIGVVPRETDWATLIGTGNLRDYW